MVHVLFADFLERNDAYRACEEYWQSLIREIEETLGQIGDWQRWVVERQRYADGTPFEVEKGNPIIDGWSSRLNRAFRIIQDRPIRTELSISAWLKSYEKGNSLTVNCSSA